MLTQYSWTTAKDALVGGWDAREWESIWRSNSGKSFTPAIGEERMEKRLHSYRWENDPAYQAAAKAEYRKQFDTHASTHTDNYVDSTLDINLDSYCDDGNFCIDDIPDIPAAEYQTILASQDEIDISEIIGLKEQQNRRKFTPDFSFSHQYLPDISFNPDTIYAVKSGIGTGKTTVVIDHIVERFEGIVQGQENVIYLGYLNSLLRQTIAKQNKKLDPIYGKRFIHINDKDNLDIDNDRLIALCIDSLLKIDLDKVINCTLVLDEIIALLSHLYFAKTHIKKHRTEIIAKFWALVSKAKTVILLDGNLTDWTLELFYKLGNKPIIKIENTYKADRKHPYKFLLGTSFEESDKINKNDKRPMIRDIIEQAVELKQINDEIEILTKKNEHELARLLIAKRRPFVIPCESQRFGESLDILLKEIGLKGYRLDGKTSRLKEAELFLDDPDSFIQVNHPAYLIYSPSAQSGLDISIKGYFKQRYGFFFGVNEVNIVDAFTQFIGRIRDDIPTKVWCRNRAASGENLQTKTNSLDELKKELDADFATKITTIVSDESMAAELKIKLLEEYKKAKDIHYDFALAMTYQAQGEQFALRDHIIARLEVLGTEVNKYTEVLDEEIKASGIKYKRARKVRDIEDSTEIYNAPSPILRDGKYETDVSETSQGYWAASVKASLYNRLPNIWSTDIWEVDFINTVRNINPNLISQLTLLTKLRNPQLEKEISKRPYKKLLAGGLGSLWTFNDDVALINALRAIGLLDLVNSSEPFFITDELPQSLIENCRAWSIRKVLGSQGKLSDQDWLRRLLGRVGHKLSATRIKRSGKNLYQYTAIPIIAVHYHSAIINCVTTKLQGYIDPLGGEVLDWETPFIPPSNVVKPTVEKSGEVFFEKEAVTVASYSLEAVPTKGISLTTDYQLSEPIDNDLVPQTKEKNVPPCEGSPDALRLAEAVKQINHTNPQNKQELHELLEDYGLDKITACIEDVTAPPKSIGDKRAVLFQWLGEIITASKLKYVGVSYYIKRFVAEYKLVEISDFSNNGLVCKLSELAT